MQLIIEFGCGGRGAQARSSKSAESGAALKFTQIAACRLTAARD
ncbi:hypothetical protein [uncultured Campylobacter sp.]|nr:hypothetical protein [uncultured Campylobacter sp.]